mmetsp:Transcript_23483/g.77275  ORF Transcript_23483/g.77275 Transcript_23483/m.77275 type:complete len:292 (-) Transcript_23483:121-996(-)
MSEVLFKFKSDIEYSSHSLGALSEISVADLKQAITAAKGVPAAFGLVLTNATTSEVYADAAAVPSGARLLLRRVPRSLASGGGANYAASSAASASAASACAPAPVPSKVSLSVSALHARVLSTHKEEPHTSRALFSAVWSTREGGGLGASSVVCARAVKRVVCAQHARVNRCARVRARACGLCCAGTLGEGVVVRSRGSGARERGQTLEGPRWAKGAGLSPRLRDSRRLCHVLSRRQRCRRRRRRRPPRAVPPRRPRSLRPDVCLLRCRPRRRAAARPCRRTRRRRRASSR